MSNYFIFPLGKKLTHVALNVDRKKREAKKLSFASVIPLFVCLVIYYEYPDRFVNDDLPQ